jgi:hypothetical protein
MAIPKGILNRIRKSSFQYLWAGQRGAKGIHLAKWLAIAAPEDLGGWGIKNIHTFM